MDLIDWINREGGPRRVSEMLGLDESTVSKWASCKAAPQFDNAYKIKMLTRGKLGFNAIYGPYFEAVYARQLRAEAEAVRASQEANKKD